MFSRLKIVVMSQVAGRLAKRIHYSQEISEAKSVVVRRFVGVQGLEDIDPILLLDVFTVLEGTLEGGL